MTAAARKRILVVDVLKRVKQMGASIPVVMVTANADNALAAERRAAAR